MISIFLYTCLPASNSNTASDAPTISFKSTLSMRTRFASLSPSKMIERSIASAGISKSVKVSPLLPSKLKGRTFPSGSHGVLPGTSLLIMPSGQDVGDAVGIVVGQDVGDVVG